MTAPFAFYWTIAICDAFGCKYPKAQLTQEQCIRWAEALASTASAWCTPVTLLSN